MKIHRITGKVLFVMAALIIASAATVFGGQASAPSTDTMSVPDVKCVIGLESMKTGAKGTIVADAKGIHFDDGKKKAEISIASIEDIYLGNESRQSIGAVKMIVPYGGGRLLSLFSHKVEVMTIDYRDENGAFHGAIFVFPPGHATAVKSILVAHGAKTTTHEPEPEEKKEPKP